ncbi:MAG TPA: hypothetical protein VGP24_16060 [Glaciihabitans sp.]|jgi:hypothetical protein|nr:hypothetical protein [Glaciihabitans sp.]
MEIDRVRTRGLFGIWGGLALLALWFTQLAIVEFDVLHSVLVILAGMMIGTRIREFTRYKRRRAAFELEHGEGAGTQDPLS